MDTITPPNDATQATTNQTFSDAQNLSQYANSLPTPNDKSAPANVPGVLPDTHITGDIQSANDSRPGWLSRTVSGIGEIAGAIGTGVADQVSSGYNVVKGGVVATVNEASALYQHPEQIASAGLQAATSLGNGLEKAGDAAAAFAVHAATDPYGTLNDAGRAAMDIVSATGQIVEKAGEATLDAGANAVQWVGDHPIETAVAVGVAAVEIASVGTATPFLAAAAAAGGAMAVHSAFGVAENLNAHSDQLSVLWNAGDHSQSELAAARQTIAKDTGAATVGLAASVAGLGAARLLGAMRAAAGGEEAVAAASSDLTGAAQSATTRGAGEAATTGGENAAAGARAEVKSNPTLTASARPQPETSPTVPVDSRPMPETDPAAAKRPASDAPPGATARPVESDQSIQREIPSNVDTLQKQPIDNSGRPLSDRNAERVAEAHQPLSAEELATQRAAAENDLSSYKGGDGSSVLSRLQNSGMSDAQNNRVLDVLAETRSSYLRPGADGQISAEQLKSYQHTLGELKEGLDSARANGLSPRETQDALLAGMLSDSHKYGWSAPAGNFFTHHLDGALAADQILSRHMGEGFNAQDLDAVRHAILEHQISPPEFMGKSYAQEVRKGMERAGVTPTTEDLARIANIEKLISDPMHSPIEEDSQGGSRLAFSVEERELLRKYVGEGTQNWHVPARVGPSESAAAGLGARVSTAGDAPNPAKISDVVRAADIFDNYSPQLGADGQAVKGPFKIAGLVGPQGSQPVPTLNDAINVIKGNMKESEALLSQADQATASERSQQADAVYAQARAATEQWFKAHGQPLTQDTPYWGKPLEMPPKGASPAEQAAWRQRPEVKLGAQIQLRFAQELHDMRLIK